MEYDGNGIWSMTGMGYGKWQEWERRVTGMGFRNNITGNSLLTVLNYPCFKIIIYME
ncbi:Uncharacterised protein [Legionella quateirensis]|uniref:Uncharacterized protein n=1 Tax=Legionella quateirensis TaxID=45072 RepID=A0A378L2A6_9GAMM|nr:Uncharacterised protein [Legionella quateirensis]